MNLQANIFQDTDTDELVDELLRTNANAFPLVTCQLVVQVRYLAPYVASPETFAAPRTWHGLITNGQRPQQKLEPRAESTPVLHREGNIGFTLVSSISTRRRAVKTEDQKAVPRGIYTIDELSRMQSGRKIRQTRGDSG